MSHVSLSRIISDLWNSNVHRWHASRSHALRNSGDTTDAHAARCVTLLVELNPAASCELIVATAYHDKAERATGDTPWGAKFASEDLRETLIFLETRENVRLGIIRWFEALLPNEWAWLKLVDRLDAYLWCQMIDRAELAKQDWRDAWADILSRADALGVREPVYDLIGECGA